MKTLLTALVIVAIAGSASAATKGPLDVMVYGDGTAAIINNGTSAFQFDGYTLTSAGGLLPADVQGIWDNGLFTPGFPATIGLTQQQCLKWAEMSTTATNYSEVTMDLVLPTMQPGGVIPLGGGFDGYNEADGDFTYVNSTLPVGQTAFYGSIIPEPTTMSLLGLSVLALVRRRR